MTSQTKQGKAGLPKSEVFRWTDEATQLECNVKRQAHPPIADHLEYLVHVAVAPDHPFYNKAPHGYEVIGHWDENGVLWWLFDKNYDANTLEEAIENATHLAQKIAAQKRS